MSNVVQIQPEFSNPLQGSNGHRCGSASNDPLSISRDKGNTTSADARPAGGAAGGARSRAGVPALASRLSGRRARRFRTRRRRCRSRSNGVAASRTRRCISRHDGNSLGAYIRAKVRVLEGGCRGTGSSGVAARNGATAGAVVGCDLAPQEGGFQASVGVLQGVHVPCGRGPLGEGEARRDAAVCRVHVGGAAQSIGCSS